MRFHLLRALQVFIAICVIYLLFITVRNSNSSKDISLPKNWIQPKLLIVKKQIGASIASKHLQHARKDQGCRLPDLPLYPPVLKNLKLKSRPLECSKVEKNWVYAKNSTFYIDPDAVSRHGQINCDYINFWRLTDDRCMSKTEANFKNGSRLNGDFFRVRCKANDGSVYDNVHAAILPSSEALKRSEEKSIPKNALGLNVYIAGFDSLSRLAFIRNLPKFFEYFTQNMSAIVLEGHNIVGDGTPQALIPMLTGKTEVELPLTRKRFRHANYVNVYPWIWNEFRDAGYATLYGEDAAYVGTFTYRLKGFDAQPTDHYMRTFYKIAEQEERKHRKYCWGSEEHHKTHFRYVEEFWTSYPADMKKFAFQFHSVYSHAEDGNTAMVSNADEFMVQHMKYFVDNGHLNNTIIIAMADHGSRFSALRETQQGKLEERLPFFAFAFPPWFASKYADHIRLFKANAKRLTTPFDIHATLQSILNFDPHPKMVDSKTRGHSLFNEIPMERMCSDAGVEPHWCSCLEWIELSITDPIAQFIGQSLVDAINLETDRERHLCAPLKLLKVEKSLKYVPGLGLRNYKKSKDPDGYVPDLSDNTPVQVEYYQVNIWTTPGNAHYEAQASLDLLTNELSIDLDTVSHVNKYGDSPHCVIDKDYFLAKWCVCYDRIRF